VFSRFFIDRPIFASVLSILITLAGALSYFALPLAQFPAVTPPTIQVDCTYPGASASTVAETVAAPIEQQVNGVERMLYMASQCNNDGSYSLTITFENGVNLNMAQVMVQNRVALAMPLLPDVVRQTGVTTRKRSPDILQVVNIYSNIDPDTGKPYYNQLYLSNYTTLQIKDEIARLDGVGDLFMFGQRDFSMRIWIDPEKMVARNLAAGDVAKALREQNLPIATGQTGQPPTYASQDVQYTVTTVGRLTDVKEFEKIIIKATPDGRVVRLKDVARVELGSKNFDFTAKVDGRASVGLVVFQLPDANALETAQRVIDKMEELKKNFPPGLEYQISYETTSYTEESLNEVYKTLLHAVLLVAAVVLLFLQNWRAALIPLAAVPVAIIGTFAVMLVMGFSLNTLTLFGLVLAIGIVVDDAIVVVEAVEHHLEHGLPPRQAAIKAMDQVAGPVVAVGLVLSAVFVPCAFISGLTGQFFRQFALTIASSTIISAFNSLTLSPALAALLLQPRQENGRQQALPRWAFILIGGWLGWLFLRQPLGNLVVAWSGDHATTAADQATTGVPPWVPTAAVIVFGGALGWLVGPYLNRFLSAGFRAFNTGFRATTRAYTRAVGGLLRVSVLALLVYGGLLLLTGWSFTAMPRGFIPSQDMGYAMMGVQLPDASSDERTRLVMDEVQQIAMKTPGIQHASAVAGQSFAVGASGPNFGSMFILFDRFEFRHTPETSSEGILKHLRAEFESKIMDAQVVVFPPPPIRGVGRAGGFKFMVEDRGDVGYEMLHEEAKNLIDKGNKDPRLMGLFTVSRTNVPQYFLVGDPREAATKNVLTQDINDTLNIYSASLYVNDFNLYGRTWQVIAQAEPRFRLDEKTMSRLQVRNREGGLVHLSTLGKARCINGPLVLFRYNMYPAVPINGNAAPGISSGQSNDAVRELARELPRNMSGEWTEMAFLEEQAGNTAIFLFGCAVGMVFLVLAAQYESWTLPLAVILVVPMCLLSAIAGVWIAKMDINIFTQIGFVVLVGLASKNAILIVEFAERAQESGKSSFEATLEACKLRLRPITMTSLAFILGVVPLLVGHGAGAEMRRTLGTAVFSGMLGVTLFGIFLTPIFFYVIDRMGSHHEPEATTHHPVVRMINRGILWGLHGLLIVATLGSVYLFTRARNDKSTS
jgi:multidrug efflux pump subunit AcrB